MSQALLDAFASEVLPRLAHPIVLVTSDYNSDRSAPAPFAVDHAPLLDDPRIAHWVSDNWHTPHKRYRGEGGRRWCVDGGRRLRMHRFSDDPSEDPPAGTSADPGGGAESGVSGGVADGSCSPHPKLTLAPIGINDRHVEGSHGDRALLLAAARALPPSAQRPPQARANFHFSKRLGWWGAPASGSCCDRADAFEALAPSHLLEASGEAEAMVGAVESSVEAGGEGQGGSAVVSFAAAACGVAEAWAGLADFAFEVSPEGNGVDAHRTWEALVLKTIPIVR